MTGSRRQLLKAASGAALVGMGSMGAATGAAVDASSLDISGVRQVTRDTVVPGHVTIRPGGGFAVAAGATLTLLGDLDAPASTVFTGAGQVDLTRGRCLAARPEWWGARPDVPGFDCGPALAACAAAHLSVQLGPGDYYLAGTWVIDRPNRRIWGIGRTKDARGSRLVLTGDTGPVMLVGSEHPPARINDYLRGVDIRWIELGRARAAPAGSAGATGLAVRHVLDCVFEGLRAQEHAVGFSLRGAVRTFVHDCAAFRSLFPDPARDRFIGFDLDGRDPPVPTGANASLYLVDCVANAGTRERIGELIGCRILGALSDTFLVRLETTNLATGILVDGRKAALTGDGRRFGHLDLHIDTPVLDQCHELGLSLVNLSDHAAVDVSGPYVGLAPGARVALEVRASGGLTTVNGGQLIGALAPGATGLLLDAADGVAVSGLKIAGFGRPVDATDASGFDLVLGVNTADAAAAGAPALRFTRCRAGYCRPRVLGPAGVHAAAVEADEASAGVAVELAGVDRRSVSALVRVGGRTAVPAPGASALVIRDASGR